MPENEYCLDNFFHKMTDLESPKKNNDCYFYYYSTCTKGDRCMFRHEPSALGCETMCSFWKEGKCINIHCNFRHMELRKNRKSIPCYWESQPGGCKKPHCPFLHLSPKSDSDNGETSNLKSNSDLKEADLRGGLKQSRNDDFGPAVDPLVVNFEEESDNESAPSQSPVKTQQQQPQQQRVVKVKTLEEIKLERIQAESAAYYSYEAEETIEEDEQPVYQQINEADFLRNRIINRLTTKQEKPKTDVKNIEILSLDEIRKRKHSRDPEPATKKPKISLPIRRAPELSEIKIKTLAEIKAERALRFGLDNKRKLSEGDDDESECSEKRQRFLEESDSEVSSTSEDVQKKPVIKLRREKSPIVFDTSESCLKRKVIKLRKTEENIDSSGERAKIDSFESEDSKEIEDENKEGESTRNINILKDEEEKTRNIHEDKNKFKVEETTRSRNIREDEDKFKEEEKERNIYEDKNKFTEEEKALTRNRNILEGEEETSLTRNTDPLEGENKFTEEEKSLTRNTNTLEGEENKLTEEEKSLTRNTNTLEGENRFKENEDEVQSRIPQAIINQNLEAKPNTSKPVVGKINQKSNKKSVSEDTDSSNSDKLELDTSKYEQLLLEEDDEDVSMTLQTDDDILDDIDSLLND